MFVTILASRYG